MLYGTIASYFPKFGGKLKGQFELVNLEQCFSGRKASRSLYIFFCGFLEDEQILLVPDTTKFVLLRNCTGLVNAKIEICMPEYIKLVLILAKSNATSNKVSFDFLGQS